MTATYTRDELPTSRKTWPIQAWLVLRTFQQRRRGDLLQERWTSKRELVHENLRALGSELRVHAREGLVRRSPRRAPNKVTSLAPSADFAASSCDVPHPVAFDLRNLEHRVEKHFSDTEPYGNSHHEGHSAIADRPFSRSRADRAGAKGCRLHQALGRGTVARFGGIQPREQSS